MMDDPYLMGLARVTVFALMLLNGVTIPAPGLFSLQPKPALIIRSMVAVIVLVPVVVLVILMSFDLPVEAATAALAIGHVMGAGASLSQRASIATACIARNLGLAVVIAAADGVLANLLPTVIAYMPLGKMALT